MLSSGLQRHTDLHRALSFKFRTQHSMHRLFVAQAEAPGAGRRGLLGVGVGTGRHPD